MGCNPNWLLRGYVSAVREQHLCWKHGAIPDFLSSEETNARGGTLWLGTEYFEALRNATPYESPFSARDATLVAHDATLVCERSLRTHLLTAPWCELTEDFGFLIVSHEQLLALERKMAVAFKRARVHLVLATCDELEMITKALQHTLEGVVADMRAGRRIDVHGLQHELIHVLIEAMHNSTPLPLLLYEWWYQRLTTVVIEESLAIARSHVPYPATLQNATIATYLIYVLRDRLLTRLEGFSPWGRRAA